MARIIWTYRGREYWWVSVQRFLVRVPWIRYSIHIEIVKRIPVD